MVEWHKLHVLCNVHVCWTIDLARRRGVQAVSACSCVSSVQLVCCCLSRGAGSSFGRAWCLVDVSFGVSSVVALCLCGLCMAAVMEHKMACGLLGCLVLLRCVARIVMVEWHKVHVLCNVHVCWENRLGSTARCAAG